VVDLHQADLSVDAERPATRSRVGFTRSILPVVLALAAAASLWAWSGTGGWLEPVGNRITTPAVVGAPVYVGYPLDLHGGDATIDAVSLSHATPSIDATFYVAEGPCPLGASPVVPESCDLRSPTGAHLVASEQRWLIAEYVPTSDGTFDPGDVVVSYRSGLHRRSVHLGLSVCMSTTVSCPRFDR
jgi:hypothetical protein